MVKLSFKLKCKICQKILDSNENLIEHIVKHANEELLSFYDAIPTATVK